LRTTTASATTRHLLPQLGWRKMRETDNPLQHATQRERWVAHINRLEQALRESRQQIGQLEARLRLREAEIETLAETTVTELDLEDAIHAIAQALEVETQDLAPLELADKCRTRATELIRALQMAWLLLNASELPKPEDNND